MMCITMEEFLFTMTAYHGQTLTRKRLCQLCAVVWDFKSWPVVIQPGIEPGSVVIPLALGHSALDRCSTQESKSFTVYLKL